MGSETVGERVPAGNGFAGGGAGAGGFLGVLAVGPDVGLAGGGAGVCFVHGGFDGGLDAPLPFVRIAGRVRGSGYDWAQVVGKAGRVCLARISDWRRTACQVRRKYRFVRKIVGGLRLRQ